MYVELKMSLIIDKVDNSEAIITVDNGSTVSNVHMGDGALSQYKLISLHKRWCN